MRGPVPAHAASSPTSKAQALVTRPMGADPTGDSPRPGVRVGAPGEPRHGLEERR